MSFKDIKLSDEQAKAVETLKEFITEGSERCITLVGAAGTGKTLITKHIIEFLERKGINFVLAAPTHKAKLVLENMSGEKAETIHRLLSLTPDIDIFELNLDELQFKSRGEAKFPAHGVVIIDEASMISDDLFDIIMIKAKDYDSKIIFQGDIKQLNPVKQGNHSKVFSLKNKITLTKIFRQDSESGVMQYLDVLRENPLKRNEFETVIKPNGSVVTFDNKKDFFLKAIDSVITAMEEENPMYCKITAWSNGRVNAWNLKVREYLFKEKANKIANKGEIITGCDNITYNNFDFYNSLDYIVDDVEYKASKYLPNFGEVKGTILYLYDTVYKDTSDIFVITEPKRVTDRLAETIEDLRIRAIKAMPKTKKYWKDYFALINSFATFCTLKFENRTIKKRTFTYGYAMTTHKLQGSSIDNMFVDLEDICNNPDPEELRQLQYVALSRTRKNVYILK